jgi:uncharacterized protein YbjT (DUF2867 family)
MKKVLLFGATGNLGRNIAHELRTKGYEVTAVVRNKTKKEVVKGLVHYCRVADVMDPDAIVGICDGFPIVISALGKPVSPNDRSKPTFRQVDLDANTAILAEAEKSGVRKFVYVSALHAEKYQHLEYFRAHHRFSERLKTSGLDYAIVKPPALFSAFLDMIPMAQKGMLFTMGKGDKLTNPIAEADLAKICVGAINRPFAIIEAGGKEVLSRHQINEIVQSIAAPHKAVKKIPLGLVKGMLPLLKLASRNLYDKMAFFTAVMQDDTLAPRVGETGLSTYLAAHVKEMQQEVSMPKGLLV